MQYRINWSNGIRRAVEAERVSDQRRAVTALSVLSVVLAQHFQLTHLTHSLDSQNKNSLFFMFVNKLFQNFSGNRKTIRFLFFESKQG